MVIDKMTPSVETGFLRRRLSGSSDDTPPVEEKEKKGQDIRPPVSVRVVFHAMDRLPCDNIGARVIVSDDLWPITIDSFALLHITADDDEEGEKGSDEDDTTESTEVGEGLADSAHSNEPLPSPAKSSLDGSHVSSRSGRSGDEREHLVVRVDAVFNCPKDKTISLSREHFPAALTAHIRSGSTHALTFAHKEEVSLDNIQLTSKETYVSRADMWLYRNRLIGQCAYLGGARRFMDISTKVSDMWMKGDIQKSGYVTEDTRVVFRSNSSVVLIYLQMSCEMWQLDPQGDLYYEKGVKLVGDEKINKELRAIVETEREKGEFDVIDKDSHRVIYDALICQRLQRGFQIVLLPKELILTSISASIRRSLSSKLLNISREIKAETTLSFSPHYHRVILTDRGVVITLFVPKERVDCSPTPEYPYYFQVPDSVVYTASRTSFKPHNLDKLDWSALDMNFNRRGFVPTFDDDMKPYSCRIIVMPGYSPGNDPRPSTSSFGRSRLAAIRRESFSSSETLYTGLSPPERESRMGTKAGQETPSDLFEGMARLLLAMNRLQLEGTRLKMKSDRWARTSSSSTRSHYNNDLSLNDSTLTPTVCPLSSLDLMFRTRFCLAEYRRIGFTTGTDTC